MNDRAASTLLTLSIAAVERDTGLSKDTLRVWERRYGFPTPGRDAFGERAYPLEQVDRLRIIRRLMDVGHRPGKIIGLEVEQLQRLAAERTGAPSSLAVTGGETDDLQRFIELIKAQGADPLRNALSQLALRVGLDRFVTEVCAPLTVMVGEAWARGYLEVFEEHLYTESIQVVLRNAISTIPATRQAPDVMLTTFPQEVHGLGLLMAEALFALEGCRCTSLGTQTPVSDIVRAAKAQRAEVIGLSFSACLSAHQVIDGLVELRASLPDAVEIWAGGQCPILQRRAPAGVRVVASLSDISTSVARWRQDRR